MSTEVAITKSVNINEEHIVQIVVSEIEEHLEKVKVDLTNQINHLIKQREKNLISITESLPVLAKEVFEKKAKILTKSMESFLETKLDINYIGTYIVVDKKVTSITLTVSLLSKDSSKGMARGSFCKTIVKEPSKFIVDTYKNYLDSGDLLDGLCDKLTEVKSKIREIPRYERKTKAKLAQTTMCSTLEGKKILDDLRNSIISKDTFLKCLKA